METRIGERKWGDVVRAWDTAEFNNLLLARLNESCRNLNLAVATKKKWGKVDFLEIVEVNRARSNESEVITAKVRLTFYEEAASVGSHMKSAFARVQVSTKEPVDWEVRAEEMLTH